MNPDSATCLCPTNNPSVPDGLEQAGAAPEGQQVQPAPPGFVPTGPQTRPWVRFWARMVDMLLFTIMLGLIVDFSALPGARIIKALIIIIIPFLYMFIEWYMLSLWGTTPGKALLNIRLRRIDDTKMTCVESLSRSFNVWLRGLGCGLLIVTLITDLAAHNRLTKDGITSWDKSGGFRVSHMRVGTGRIIAVMSLFVGFGLIVAFGGA